VHCCQLSSLDFPALGFEPLAFRRLGIGRRWVQLALNVRCRLAMDRQLAAEFLCLEAQLGKISMLEDERYLLAPLPDIGKVAFENIPWRLLWFRRRNYFTISVTHLLSSC
jgi:hypothetical protein